MEFYEVVQKRRSVRKFQPSEISDEALMRIVDAGRRAPSGANVQNREFVIVRDRKVLEQLHERVQPDFANAAAAIALVMNDASTKWGSYWVEDASAAATSMLLAVVNEGYDSVWVEGTLRAHEDWAKDMLAVPADKRLFVLLPIGKAAQEGRQAPKADMEDVVYYERYE